MQPINVLRNKTVLQKNYIFFDRVLEGNTHLLYEKFILIHLDKITKLFSRSDYSVLDAEHFDAYF